MWTLLTYAYNSILIIFIATHLLVGAIISFIGGLYVGVYISQNYNIPRITEPSKLWEKMVVYMEQRRIPPKDPLKLKGSSGSSSAEDGGLGILSIIKADSINENDEEGLTKGNGTPTLIFSEEPLHSDQGPLHRSPSQILQASLIISN